MRIFSTGGNSLETDLIRMKDVGYLLFILFSWIYWLQLTTHVRYVTVSMSRLQYSDIFCGVHPCSQFHPRPMRTTSRTWIKSSL